MVCLTFQHIFTDEDLYDREICNEVEDFATYILAHSRFQGSDYDIVLEVRDPEDNEQGDNKKWCYYFVNHLTKVIFWLGEYPAHDMIKEVRGIDLNSHKSCISE